MAVGPAFTQGDQVFPLNKATNSIGRKDRITNLVPDIDLATVDQERAVSRKHAEATYQGGRILLRDVGSTNGTTVNGEPLQLQVDRELFDGDRVSLGGYEVVFAAATAWPEGVEAQWPTEAPAGPETQVFRPEETAVMRPDETAMMPPAGETAGATGESALAGAADVYTPPAGADAPEAEVADSAEAPAEPAPDAGALGEPATASPADTAGAAPADDGAAAVAEPPEAVPVTFEPLPPEPVPAAADGSVSFTPCTNHPHLPAIGLCPGCLDPFCVDCLPERPGQALACNRCAGILARLAVVSVDAAPVAAGGFPAAEAGGFPPPPPPGAPSFTPPPAAEAPHEEKKKKWPF